VLAPVSKTNENAISLIENSGIQFIDMEFVLNPNASSGKDMSEIMMIPMLDRSGKESHLALLEKSPSGEGMILPGAGSSSRKYNEDDPKIVAVEFADVVKSYDGVWFPLPYFTTNVLDEKGLMSPNGREVGPVN
jgi:hypothetical protein